MAIGGRSDGHELLERARQERARFREWLEERATREVELQRDALRVRTLAQELVELREGQTGRRVQAERMLRDADREMRHAQTRLGEPRDDELNWVDIGGDGVVTPQFILTHGPTGRVDDWEVVADQFKRERHELLTLIEYANERAVLDEARAEADQAAACKGAACRRSADTFEPAAVGSPRASLIAGLPFLAFLLVAAVGAAFEPEGAAAWVAVGVLAASVVGAAWATARRGSSRGLLAGLGAAGAFALFTVAYLICRLADADTLVREGASVMPVHTIGDVCLVALTVGLTGGTLDVALSGAARAVAFVQILLTIGAVVALITYGWRVLALRVARDRDAPAE